MNLNFTSRTKKAWSIQRLDKTNIVKSNIKRGSKQIVYYNIFVSRNVTFAFSFQEITVFTFASLALRGHEVSSSLRDKDLKF